MRHNQRNPQKSLANPVPDPEKIIKGRKLSQKGASGLGKPKQSSISLKERLVIEQIHVVSIAFNTSSEEKLLEIHKVPYSLGSPLALSLNETSPPIPHIPLFLLVTPQLSIIQTAGTLQPARSMAGPQALTKMERIIATRYGPLVLPTPLNAIPTGEYQKYI